MDQVVASLVLILLSTLFIFICKRFPVLSKQTITINLDNIDFDKQFLDSTKRIYHSSWFDIFPHPVSNQARECIPYAVAALHCLKVEDVNSIFKHAVASRIRGDSEMIINAWFESGLISAEVLIRIMFNIAEDDVEELNHAVEGIVDMMDSSKNFLKLPVGQFLYRISWNDTIAKLESFLDRFVKDDRKLNKDFLACLKGIDRKHWRGVCLVVLSSGVMKLRSLLLFEWIKLINIPTSGNTLDESNNLKSLPIVQHTTRRCSRNQELLLKDGKRLFVAKGTLLQIMYTSNHSELNSMCNPLEQCPAKVLVLKIENAFKLAMNGYIMTTLSAIQEQSFESVFFRDILCLKEERYICKIQKKEP